MINKLENQNGNHNHDHESNHGNNHEHHGANHGNDHNGEHGHEHEGGHGHEYHIRINNRPFVVKGPKITFEEVVRLAGQEISTDPNLILTVTYEHGPDNQPEGTLILGQSVRVKEGMMFYVKVTNNS
jgi:hypothetical protein